jgi:hypothetical protein
MPVAPRFSKRTDLRRAIVASPRTRFTVADVLLYVAFAGLFLAWVKFVGETRLGVGRRQPDDLPTFVALLAAVLVLCCLWSFMQAMRTAPTCTVCGRRFMAPPQPAETAICTKCRRRSLNPPQPEPTGERPRAN